MSGQRPKRSGRRLAAEELSAQEGLELPDRHAMSLMSGMPSLDGGGLIGGTTPTDGGTAPSDGGTGSPSTGVSTPLDDGGATGQPGPTTDPGPTGTTQTFAPINKAEVLNQLSSGATQEAGSTQSAPITQTT